MMHKKQPHNAVLNRYQGFSLIELMVAMLVGLIILNGVVQVVISSKRAYLDNQAISQIQENARFAVETLSREIRVAGYVGCMPVEDGVMDTTSLTTVLPGLLLDGAGNFAALQTFNDVNAANTGLPAQIQGSVAEGTDVLIVRHTDTSREWIVGDDLANLGGSLTISGEPTPRAGQPMALVSQDCAMANLFAAGEVTGASGAFSVTIANPAGSLGLNNFKKGSRVSPVVATAYYIGTSSVLDGMPALMREVIVMNGGAISSRAEELAIGVEGMDIELGTVGAAGVVFNAANPIGTNPVAVRMSLTLRSHERVNPQVEPDDQGNGGDDGFIRQVASATVRVRNQG